MDKPIVVTNRKAKVVGDNFQSVKTAETILMVSFYWCAFCAGCLLLVGFVLSFRGLMLAAGEASMYELWMEFLVYLPLYAWSTTSLISGVTALAMAQVIKCLRVMAVNSFQN